SATALVMLLGANAARASITGGGMAATLSSASALAGTSAVGNSLLITLMNGATITKIIAAAAALLIISGAVHHFTRPDIGSFPAGQPALESNRISGGGEFSQTKAENPKALASVSRERPQASGPAQVKTIAAYDEAALKAAREKFGRFMERLGQLAIISDPLRV